MTPEEREAFYVIWRAALRGGTVDWDNDQNISGFWRISAAKTKADTPVAIWPDHITGKQVVKIGRKNPAAEGSEDWHNFISWSWTKCVPVGADVYRAALANGVWPDGKPAWMEAVERPLKSETPGDNQPKPEETLADEIATLAEALDKADVPGNQKAANVLAEKLDRMRALLKRAEVERTKEKQPFLDAGRGVDAKWGMITEPGANAYDKATRQQKQFLKAEQARLDKIAAEERARLIEEAKKNAPEIPPEAVEKLVEQNIPAAPAPKAHAGSAFGRAQGLRKVKIAVIDDIEKLVDHLVEIEDKGFVEYLQGRAQAAARANVALPGVTIKEEKQ